MKENNYLKKSTSYSLNLNFLLKKQILQTKNKSPLQRECTLSFFPSPPPSHLFVNSGLLKIKHNRYIIDKHSFGSQFLYKYYMCLQIYLRSALNDTKNEYCNSCGYKKNFTSFYVSNFSNNFAYFNNSTLQVFLPLRLSLYSLQFHQVLCFLCVNML